MFYAEESRYGWWATFDVLTYYAFDTEDDRALFLAEDTLRRRCCREGQVGGSKDPKENAAAWRARYDRGEPPPERLPVARAPHAPREESSTPARRSRVSARSAARSAPKQAPPKQAPPRGSSERKFPRRLLEVLELASRDGGVSVKEVEELLGITASAAATRVSQLKQGGHLERVKVHGAPSRYVRLTQHPTQKLDPSSAAAPSNNSHGNT